ITPRASRITQPTCGLGLGDGPCCASVMARCIADESWVCDTIRRLTPRNRCDGQSAALRTARSSHPDQSISLITVGTRIALVQPRRRGGRGLLPPVRILTDPGTHRLLYTMFQMSGRLDRLRALKTRPPTGTGERSR